ncbi:MAG: DUF4430 domain-containing protein [bacterium]
MSTSAIAKSGFSKKANENKITVTIEIIADSSNTITASVTAEPGTNARDLLEKLFQIDYADRGKKFINGIAGFQTRRFKREYWALEVNGEYSKIGIAEIVLQKSTKIVWRMKSY